MPALKNLMRQVMFCGFIATSWEVLIELEGFGGFW
jgi:hypothetical protein